MITIFTDAASMTLLLGLPTEVEEHQPSSTAVSSGGKPTPSEGGAYVQNVPQHRMLLQPQLLLQLWNTS
eukprot:2234156-Amphidinium_carterae.3